MTRCLFSTPIEGITQWDLNLNDLLGEGANAKVFREKIGANFYAVKVYTDLSSFNQEKLSFMISNPPTDLYMQHEGSSFPKYAWALSLVKNLEIGRSGTEIGYIMPLIDRKRSKTLEYFYDFNLSKQLTNPLNKALSFKIEILKNLASSLAGLHLQGHQFVDLKPPNIGVFEGTNIVSLLDCDGFSITDHISGKIFPSNMVSPDYISPEIYAAKIDEIKIEKTQDNYAFAVMVFQMLNNGIHPFQGIIKDPNIQISTNDEAALKGFYAYGIQGSPHIFPKPQSVHQTFLPSTRMLFDRAFLSKVNRPSPEEWKIHLNDILEHKQLVRCVDFPTDVTHIRFKDMPCPACTLNAQNAAAANNNSPGLQASISGFDDIAHEFEQPPVEQVVPSNGSGSFILVSLCIALSVFVLIKFVSSLSPQPTSQNSNFAPSVAVPAPTPPVTQTGSNAYTSMAGKEICEKAMNGSKDGWDTGQTWLPYVREANRRGISIADCRRILNVQVAPNIPAAPNVPANTQSNEDVCRNALDGSKTGWDTSPSFGYSVTEARRRGLTIADCRNVLREPSVGSSTRPPSQSQNIPYAPPSFDCSRAKVAAEQLICEYAELAAADRRLAEAFNRALNRLSSQDQRNLRTAQRSWLPRRNSSCNLPQQFIDLGRTHSSVPDCLRNVMESRIDELNRW